MTSIAILRRQRSVLSSFLLSFFLSSPPFFCARAFARLRGLIKTKRDGLEHIAGEITFLSWRGLKLDYHQLSHDLRRCKCYLYFISRPCRGYCIFTFTVQESQGISWSHCSSNQGLIWMRVRAEVKAAGTRMGNGMVLGLWKLSAR